MTARMLIYDYGLGNLFSLRTALERQGAEVSVVKEMKAVREADAIILPGVGGFSPAARHLREDRERLKESVDSGVLLIGVCLGMQLFFEGSEEGRGRGISLLKGRVVRLPDSVKTPHMGWNNIRIVRETPFLDGVEDGSRVYFVHSYYPRPSDESCVAAEAEYGVRFPAVVAKGNILGTQFHPEKSGRTGARILSNILSYCRR